MNRKSRLVEVFVERDCPSCEEVISIVKKYRNDPSVELQIYERETDVSVFHKRRVIICPATFIDHRLIFYGAFTVNEFARYLS